MCVSECVRAEHVRAQFVVAIQLDFGRFPRVKRIERQVNARPSQRNAICAGWWWWKWRRNSLELVFIVGRQSATSSLPFCAVPMTKVDIIFSCFCLATEKLQFRNCRTCDTLWLIALAMKWSMAHIRDEMRGSNIGQISLTLFHSFSPLFDRR